MKRRREESGGGSGSGVKKGKKGKAKSVKAAIKEFVELYRLAGAAEGDEAVVGSMHAMRRAVVKGASRWPGEARWGKAYAAYARRLCEWAGRGAGGAVGQVVSVRSAAKAELAASAESPPAEGGLARVVASITAGFGWTPEAAKVLGEEAAKSKRFRLSALAGLKKGSKRVVDGPRFAAATTALAEVSTNLPQKIEAGKETRVAVVDAWLAVLRSVPADADASSLEKALRDAARLALPVANKPLRFADAYVGALRTSASQSPTLALAALEGLFPLVAEHGLDYPTLYDDMRRLVDDLNRIDADASFDVVQTFLGFLNQALASPLATNAVRLDFARALADRVALQAPPQLIVALLDLFFRLKAHCPPVARAVRPAVAHLESHYVPAVANVARRFNAGRPPLEDLEVAAFTYDNLFAAQLPASRGNRDSDRKNDFDDFDDHDDDDKAGLGPLYSDLPLDSPDADLAAVAAACLDAIFGLPRPRPVENNARQPASSPSPPPAAVPGAAPPRTRTAS